MSKGWILKSPRLALPSLLISCSRLLPTHARSPILHCAHSHIHLVQYRLRVQPSNVAEATAQPDMGEA